MRWRRGLFRVWVLVSSIWIIGVAGAAIADWRDHPAPACATKATGGPWCSYRSSTDPYAGIATPVIPQPPPGYTLVGPGAAFTPWPYLWLALGVPTATLAMGVAIFWVLAGFHSEPKVGA